MLKQQILGVLPLEVRQKLQFEDAVYDSFNEIRFRVNRPITLIMNNKEYGIRMNNGIFRGFCNLEKGEIVSEESMRQIMQSLSKYSMYSLEQEIRQGYFTLEGGHRVGITGEAVSTNDGIKTFSNVSSINIRISHQIIGCSNPIMKYIINDNKRVLNTLIISPPRCGKTTLIRDIARNLSDGYSYYPSYTVGIVDERSEIAGCYRGVPQNDVGIRTDVLDKCRKPDGMRMLVRSMAPQVIVVDEIGSEDDINALEESLCTGVSIIATVHGDSIDDCYNKPRLSYLVINKMIDRIIVLSNKKGIGSISGVYDVTTMRRVDEEDCNDCLLYK